MDISGFINVYLSGVLSVAKNYYDTLDGITFGGISVLDYAITLLILSVVIPMVITLTKSGLGQAYDEITYTKRKEREIKREKSHEKKDAKAKVNAAKHVR